MDFFQEIINSYGSFFSVEAIQEIFTNPASWGIIGTLIILEGLLSADNALVLAVMVKHLPPKQQKRALFYGILGAYVFRFLAIGLGVFLIKITWIKVAGGLYLIWLVVQYFIKKNKEDENVENKQMGFWRTVLAVELMDIAFSIDSVIAAFGVSDQIWVLFVGGMLGVLMMRGVAQVFLALIAKVPELETAAFILIAIIGTKMIAGAFGFEISQVLFFSILIAIFLGTFVVHYFRKKANNETAN
ncbi:TerC family protein [Metabacillus fastidiosus]|uniref:TerC family protein n=1 Tax=Metabacillus fastidiosus TaxID=1458 RepID=A0ABU6P356_9BACI|nr:TerC family protein [Metabacillus fastidiosus]MED4403800.1 TerC family protein [Metabacillus fastidiosus]MED4452580.1 TerC family protein [Metabacillus fastidiosus]MED4463489.1 TerC family protein [Metabacillus fastidiosus]